MRYVNHWILKLLKNFRALCIYAWFFMHCRNHHSDSHPDHIIMQCIVTGFNTLRSRLNGCHFADVIFRCIFFNENVWIPIKISLNFVPKGPINNIPALVQMMAWRLLGDKPLSELTRTTRTPAFWGYPLPPHDYPYYWPVHFESQVHTIDQLISDPKSKQDESRKIWKICEKLKF